MTNNMSLIRINVFIQGRAYACPPCVVDASGKYVSSSHLFGFIPCMCREFVPIQLFLFDFDEEDNKHGEIQSFFAPQLLLDFCTHFMFFFFTL